MWESYTIEDIENYLDRNIYAQVFSNMTFFAEIYPIYRRIYYRIALKI